MPSILEPTRDPVINLALDTLKKEKQAIVFVNTKRGAERVAELIAKKLNKTLFGINISQQALKVLSRPTKQCERLAGCLEKGIAFHHAGLVAKQRELVEDGFREKQVLVICA